MYCMEMPSPLKVLDSRQDSGVWMCIRRYPPRMWKDLFSLYDIWISGIWIIPASRLSIQTSSVDDIYLGTARLWSISYCIDHSDRLREYQSGPRTWLASPMHPSYPVLRLLHLKINSPSATKGSLLAAVSSLPHLSLQGRDHVGVKYVFLEYVCLHKQNDKILSVDIWGV